MKKLIFMIVLVLWLIPCNLHSGRFPVHSYGTDWMPAWGAEIKKKREVKKARQEEMERQLLFEKR